MQETQRPAAPASDSQGRRRPKRRRIPFLLGGGGGGGGGASSTAAATTMALLALVAASLWRPGRAFVLHPGLPAGAAGPPRSGTSLRLLAASSAATGGGGGGGKGGGGGDGKSGGSSGNSSSRLKRLVKGSSSFSFNRAPGPSGREDSSPAPPPPPPRSPRSAGGGSGGGGASKAKGGAAPGGRSSRDSPESSGSGGGGAPVGGGRRAGGGGKGPAREDPGQHLTPKGMGPRESFDIDARPNSRKARKAAASASAGGGPAGGGEWDTARPSKLQQRRDKRAAKAAEEKMKRLKVRSFSKAGLLGQGGREDGAAADGEGPDELRCEHFLACSGCFFRAGLTQTPVMEDARIFFRRQVRLPEGREFGVSMPTGVHEWRTQAKLAIAKLSKWGGCRIGLYEEGTHRVIPIPHCRVHHPSINAAVGVIARATEAMKTRAFDHDQLDGALRYVQCAVERRTGKVQLTLVWNAPGKKEAGAELSRLLKALRAADPDNELWHSVWVNFRTGPGNAIFSRDPRSWHKAYGQDFLTEAVGPSRVVFHLTPQLFRQGNLDGFSKLVARAQDFVPSQSTICELYAGVGIIGLNMLGKARELRFSDINPFLPAAVERTIEGLSEKRREKVGGFLVATALEALEAGTAVGADLLIVDPPRKGLEPEVLAHLTAGKRDPLAGDIRRIIYVSCGFEALKRDAAALVGAGWRAVHAEGFVLFPGSDHLETLCIFDR